MFPVLVSIGPVHIFSYSVFIVLAWLAFSFIFWRCLRSQGVEEERIFDLSFYTTLVALAVARAVFVLTHLTLFTDNLIKIAAIWVQSGLSYAGALVSGLIILLLLAKRYKVRFGLVLDALAFALPVAWVTGEVGSFLDGTELGRVTSLAWGVRYVGQTSLRHPVQLYTIAAVLIILFLVALIARKAAWEKWPYGLVGVWWFFMSSIALFVLEFVKDTSVYWVGLSANQWLMIAIFAESVGAFYVRGGGRGWLRQVRGGIYAKFSKRHA